ncbi:MAG: hypothetical protein QG567_2158 [Campylobacterota bacterium]|nr:hypothetical protein [Campylobacterota bacterium]
MCAIAGAINCDKFNLNLLQNAMLHRGPDEHSSYTHKNITLLHNRLSIVDIADGHQPMHYKEFTLIFNGEIYNHKELRDELKDFVFKTSSDTETLLYLLVKFGIEGLSKVDGMFAIAFLNKAENSLILIRDRIGKKPLYWYKKDDIFVFASEINGIKNLIKLKTNEQHIYNYLRCGYFFGESTAYENLFALGAGSYLEIDLNTLALSKKIYFDISKEYEKKEKISLEDALLKTDEYLHKSIKNRLLSSDLEVGAFLSGGIDSGLIVGVASEYLKNLKTFTVSFGKEYDESALAKEVALKYKTNHTTIDIQMNVKNDIQKILANYSQPFFDSSAIPSYYVSKEAKKFVTVVLNGDGADELFGGYRRYVPAANGLIEKAKKLNWLLRFMPKPHNKKNLYSHLFRLLDMSSKKEPFDFYLSSTIDIFEGFEKNINQDCNNPMREHLKNIYQKDISLLSKMLLNDDSCLLFSNLLVKMDIAAMSNSLEARSPFLSKYFLEFAPSLPDNMKVLNKTTKFLLRELSKKYLPKNIQNQPKRGFEVPLKEWIENDLKEMIFSALDGSSYVSNFINKKFLAELLDKKIAISDEKRARIIWLLFSVEVWKENDKTYF